jgi:hypothetical protein
MMDNSPERFSLKSAQGASFPAPRYVTQPQDHFDTSNKKSWQQAYYVNDTFWAPGSNAPIFLCVGGEGPALDGSAVVSSVHCNIAVEWLQEKKALMFALEHRYYGCHNMSACPVGDFANATASLKHLSSRQAIEDIAGLVRAMNRLYGLSDANKWVTFGGSYPGILAGWSRLQHPELIHAAVASSAPVHAKLDMFEYNDAVANAYTVSDNGVGGSPECRDAIRAGHKMLEDMVKTEKGVSAAEDVLSLPRGSLSKREDQVNILGSGVAYFPAQENDPACTTDVCNIKKICAFMLDSSHGNELQRLAKLRNVQGVGKSRMQEPAVPDFWFYQTCTEFGFYQTCSENSSCMYVRGLLDVKAMAGDCQRYGISIDNIAKNIERTNRYHGGITPLSPSGKLGSCVLWPNGEVDPWATLSVLKSPGAAQPTLWVEGASHHAWTWPSRSADQPSVVKAREDIRRQVETFLAQSCTEDSATGRTAQFVV